MLITPQRDAKHPQNFLLLFKRISFQPAAFQQRQFFPFIGIRASNNALYSILTRTRFINSCNKTSATDQLNINGTHYAKSSSKARSCYQGDKIHLRDTFQQGRPRTKSQQWKPWPLNMHNRALHCILGKSTLSSLWKSVGAMIHHWDAEVQPVFILAVWNSHLELWILLRSRLTKQQEESGKTLIVIQISILQEWAIARLPLVSCIIHTPAGKYLH